MRWDSREAEARLDELMLRLSDEQRRSGDLETRLHLVEKSLWWRLGWPLRRLARSSLGEKLRAFLRHPRNPQKRKQALVRFCPVATTPPGDTSTAGKSTPHQPMELLQAIMDTAGTGLPPPRITAIVPNYNHARFLDERLRSICRQTFPVAEIIILDDASTDDSQAVIQSLVGDLAVPVVTLFNRENSGSIFSQWAKGLAHATGDLVWICESDDTCDRNFLASLEPYFRNPCVMLAFGLIEEIDEHGYPRPGMRDYMNSAAADFWDEPHVLSARAWFNGPFGTRNVIPNVGGCVFRRQEIDDDLLRELQSYRICGDWHLYSVIGRGGAIAYDPRARSYFRKHAANTSGKGARTEAFFDEHIRIAHALRRHYGTAEETIAAMRGHVMKWYASEFGKDAGRRYAERHPLAEYMAQEQATEHVLVVLEPGGNRSP
jgi:glycosyltransferase involved in cell wall biosynthesis